MEPEQNKLALDKSTSSTSTNPSTNSSTSSANQSANQSSNQPSNKPNGKKLTMEDILGINTDENKNRNNYIPKVEIRSSRMQGEYGHRKRIKP